MADLTDPIPTGSTPGPQSAPKRHSLAVLALAAFVLAAGVALSLSWTLARAVEVRSSAVVTTRLLAEGYTWAKVDTDGLIVSLSGTAPTETLRFSALNLAGSVIDASRLQDNLDVEPAKIIAAPRFSVEILRNDDEVQLIGLVPDGEDKDRLAEATKALTEDQPQTDMLQTAAYPAPEGWKPALDLGIVALKLLPHSKISVSDAGVVINAIAASAAEKRAFEAAIATASRGLSVRVTISAPRPVLTPFTLRFVVDGDGARFDACSADTEKARDRILSAARIAGTQGRQTCTVGLGVPSPRWAEATSLAITSLAKLGGGTVTFSDADITLLAGSDVTQAAFDREIGELRSALPDVFSLDAQMPEKAAATVAGPVEFTASLAVETHRVELRGRLTDDRVQAAVASFAKARFGADKVYVATVLDPMAPDGWPERVLAGLQSLAKLDHGTLIVRPDTVEVAGTSGSVLASADISQLLSETLGQGKTFKVSVKYDKTLDPLAALPTPQDCIDNVHDVAASKKISFDPGSAELDAASIGIMDALAKALKNCNGIKIEIGGHTDAQGSATGNLALSQARAEAVLVALQGRQVDVSGMTAVGYGEGVPVADNGTDVGREANRRIEFRLLAGQTAQSDDTATEPDTTATAMAANGPEQPVPGLNDPAFADPDFPDDDSPSVAPTAVSKPPKPRP
ncbi:MAG: OmpA family protein [bacterium]